MRLGPGVLPDAERASLIEVPWTFLGGSEGRLIPELRDAAQTMDPVEILARAAIQFLEARSDPTVVDTQFDTAYGNALADLAVSGRTAYEAFAAGVEVADIEDSIKPLLPTGPEQPTSEQIRSAIGDALDRAYAVAWALRGPVEQRAALRAPLGWIAVSGEDDTPHRPVNMPAPPYEQYEVSVTATDFRIATRFFIASANYLPPAGKAPETRSVPTDPKPRIPSTHEVILFLHGHSSGAEEALDIIPHLLREGQERGKLYSVVSFDLPNNGYSQTFDHAQVADLSKTTYPDLPTDHGPIKTPVLDFIEDFVVAFVNALDRVTVDENDQKAPMKNRIAAVIGGSLGGNLTLRLDRHRGKVAWLQKVASWSPASVWPPMVADAGKRLAPQAAFNACAELKSDGMRAKYFNAAYDKPPLPGIIDPQPEYWYRRGWREKELHVDLSRLARWEIYNDFYRQWHWRVAGEQLIYSHWDRDDHEDANSPLRYTQNTGPMLLATGQSDNYIGAHIYDNTLELAKLMTNCEGRLLPVYDTGHSIHIERPAFFAHEIVNFLNARSFQITCMTRADGRIRAVGVIDRTNGGNAGAAVPMTLDECMTAIQRGDQFFVRNVGQTPAWVDIRPRPSHGGGRPNPIRRPGVSGQRGYYIATDADQSTGNNLDALPRCPV